MCIQKVYRLKRLLKNHQIVSASATPFSILQNAAIDFLLISAYMTIVFLSLPTALLPAKPSSLPVLEIVFVRESIAVS